MLINDIYDPNCLQVQVDTIWFCTIIEVEVRFDQQRLSGLQDSAKLGTWRLNLL
jgi:hypothetical protein